MMNRLPALFSFLLLSSIPVVGDAQTRCPPTRESIVEIISNVSIIDGVSARVEPVTRHLSATDHALVTHLVHALLERLRIPCEHHVRVRYDYHPLTRIYEARLSIRQPQDQCWEQVQCDIRVHDGTRNETPSGTSPVAATVNALAHGDVLCTAMRILCPSDPQP
ncbi:MAG: hypothetical protein NUW08_00195 [Candidatus Uhrbacteria bacterium]|nr:hypothetical protein [Candidatus Uhrbacteria bacterium]